MCWHLETMSSRQFVHTGCILLLVLTGIIQHYLSLKNYFCRVQIESFLANFYTIHLNIIVLILCYALINLYCSKTYKYSAWKLDPIHWGSKPKYFALGQQPVVRWSDNTVISSENPCSWTICHYYCFIRKGWMWCGIKFYGHAVNCYLDQI